MTTNDKPSRNSKTSIACSMIRHLQDREIRHNCHVMSMSSLYQKLTKNTFSTVIYSSRNSMFNFTITDGVIPSLRDFKVTHTVPYRTVGETVMALVLRSAYARFNPISGK